MSNKTRVLFLCTHNSARSQMAEAFLRKYGSEHFEAHSAGLEPAPIHPYTFQVMHEVGIDLEEDGHHPKGIWEDYIKKHVHVGHLITVCSNAEANCPVYPGVGEREYWGFEDPAAFEGSDEEKLAKFREIRNQVEARVKAFIEENT
jgi:arsenate reductase